MTKPLKIHWFSNAPWAPTGYGNQTRVFLPRLAKLDEVEMTAGAFYGVQGAPLNAHGVPVFPASRDPYGNDMLAADAYRLNADLVITLMDVWVLHPSVTNQFKWCPWLPVDHDPVPPHVIEALNPAYQPITYSKFGSKKLKEAGVGSLYVPHGVETNIFKPVDNARQAQGWPEDKFIVGMVMANKGAPSRKAFDQQIRAFAQFRTHHKDAMLYLHTEMKAPQGIDIGRLLELNDIPSEAVIACSQWEYLRGVITWDDMARVYSALDVLMNATKGEGFGLPIIEAQSCGCPVIVTDFSAMPELVRSGWAVGWSDKFYSQESYQVTPSVPDMVDALEQAHKRKGDQEFRQQARAAMVKEYDADVIMSKYWEPALKMLRFRMQQDESTKNLAPSVKATEKATV